MPILLQEVRRRPPTRRKRFMGVPPMYLVYAAVCSGIVAGWLFRPGSSLFPARTATITIVPSPAPVEWTDAAPQPQAHRAATASQKIIVPPPADLDRNPVGSIETPRASATGFSDVQRASPENYTGFREITPRR